MEKKRNTHRYSNEKILMVALVVAILVGCAVGGTIAYFTDQTEVITNTFTVGKLFTNPATQFTLWEHKAVDENASGKKDGVYELTSEEVVGNSYTVLPGVDIPKDPTVDIVDLELNAYLYIKVEGTLPSGMTTTIDPANWEALTGYTGIYVYKGAGTVSNVIDVNGGKKTLEVNILKDKQIIVNDTFTTDTAIPNLKFTAYAVQAPGFSSAAEAWDATFGK